jgi:hypothetical protein
MARLLGRACFCFQRIAFILYFSFALRVHGYAISYTCDNVGADDIWITPEIEAAMKEAKEIIDLAVKGIVEVAPLDNTRDKLFPGDTPTRERVQGE